MRYARWLLVIAGVAGFGCLQVAQRTAILLKGYALGERMERVHSQQTAVSLETMKVEELSSPAHLAQVAQDERMNFVAAIRIAAAQPEAGD